MVVNMNKNILRERNMETEFSYMEGSHVAMDSSHMNLCMKKVSKWNGRIKKCRVIPIFHGLVDHLLCR
jgi:hypothetical protein